MPVLRLVLSTLLLALVAHGNEDEGTCSSPECMARDSVLLQTKQAKKSSTEEQIRNHKRSWTAVNATSDCRTRFGYWEQSNAACILVDHGRALLVHVPYGDAPGWDFPGGWRHHGEHACETAEREVCEETGFKVRAVQKIKNMVYLCEVVERDFCKNPVDEGFLSKGWFADAQLDSLTYRGGSWGGGKKDLIRQHVGAAPDWEDVCGCKMCHNEGHSTTTDSCQLNKHTDVEEACSCASATTPQGETARDSCGCDVCNGQGWSSSRGHCHWGSHTRPHEACDCKHRSLGHWLLQTN